MKKEHSAPDTDCELNHVQRMANLPPLITQAFLPSLRPFLKSTCWHGGQPMDDFENFEFIDYTTSGPWERFITQIEESLRLWGLVDKKLGVFDPVAIAAQQPAADVDNSSPSSPTAHAHSGSHDRLKSQKNQQSYQVREMLSLDDATYALSYHYHPAKAKIAEGVEGIDLDFLPNTLEGVQHHHLHRWTSLTHVLIISPVTISDIFASTMSSSTGSVIVDLNSAKLLLSSFAIAFQNTGCAIPVFVPTGQPWDLTFMGLMIQSQLSAPPLGEATIVGDSETFLYMDEYDEEFEDDQGIEVRFNTFVVPYPPIHYSTFSGITDLFIRKMEIKDTTEILTLGNHSQRIKEQIFITALFCYDLVNWHDEDWKRWSQPDEKHKKGGRGIDGDLVDDDGPTMNTPEASMNMEDINTGSRTLSTLPIPIFPFGPVQDPLRSMRLLARFGRRLCKHSRSNTALPGHDYTNLMLRITTSVATAPSSLYLDNRTIADMDASCANIWILQAAFRDDDYGILGAIMEDAIASWSSEAANNGRDDRDSEKDQSYRDSLLNKGAKLIQGAISMVDTVDVENILDALFDPQLPPAPSRSTAKKADGCVRLIPASELGLQFRHASTVPYNSFLWRMIQYLLDVISPNSEISYATSVMGFMKVLWSELLKQFFTRWENNQLIPLVDIYGECHQGTPLATESFNQDQEKKPVAIDLRYNLLHQKLTMLNCCIARQILREKEAPEVIHPLPGRRREPSRESHASPMPSPNPPLGSGAVHRRSAQLHSLLHGLSDISRQRSADVVPMAKRLFETVKNRGFPPNSPLSQDSSSSSPVPSTSSSGILIPQVTSTESSSPIGDSSIPQGEPMNRRRSNSSRHHSHSKETLLDSDDDDVFYDPLDTSESTVEPIDIQRKNQPLTESFVALRYSSSVDSQSGVLVSDLDQTTVIALGLDPREVVDDAKSEGSLVPLKDLKLLRTGAPLMIPKLQVQ
jgi:hypothetical protein